MTNAIKQTESTVQPVEIEGRPEIAVGQFWFYTEYSLLLMIDEERGEKFHVNHKYLHRGEWSGYGELEPARFEKCVYLGKTESEARARVDELTAQYENGDLMREIDELQNGEVGTSDSMELLRQQDKVLALQQRAQKMLEVARVKVDQMKMVAELKKDEIARKLREASEVIKSMYGFVEKVQRIVRSLELYGGINESLEQLQEGEPAPEGTPFCIRQAVVFMDEEVGQWREGGFDYTDVSKFDAWLQTPANLYRVAPEPKCLVAFRPRRNPKDYPKNDDMKAEKNIWNRQTYFLIRNGGNLYRIFTDNLQLPTKIFLSATDMQKMADNNEFTDEVKDLFTRQALFIQGLIERGEVLNPVPEGVNIFQPETYQGWLRLIYDADGVLTDGRLPWKAWRKSVNAEISEGSRVIIAEGWLGQVYHKDLADTMTERTKRYYGNSWYCPQPPRDGGLFIVEKGFKGGHRNDWPLAFRYFPGGEYWSWGGVSVERKNRVLFGFEPNESGILNYDGISLADVEYYINDRVQRKDYLDMLPLLEKIRTERLNEIEQEASFVRLVSDTHGVDPAKVWPLVDWWKLKNKWKRPIRKDDTLALRMITRRIESMKKKGKK